jgi:hypothetical protein
MKMYENDSKKVCQQIYGNITKEQKADTDKVQPFKDKNKNLKA